MVATISAAAVARTRVLPGCEKQSAGQPRPRNNSAHSTAVRGHVRDCEEGGDRPMASHAPVALLDETGSLPSRNLRRTSSRSAVRYGRSEAAVSWLAGPTRYRLN